MAEESELEVIYRSGTNAALGAGWDVMQVVYRRMDGGQMRIANSFVIARDASGKIIRKTDIILDRWEVVNDQNDLGGFQRCFDERDRLNVEKPESVQYMGAPKDRCHCGHPFSAHTRNVRETSGACVDGALLAKKSYEIFSDKPQGESGCTQCSCRQWKPADY